MSLQSHAPLRIDFAGGWSDDAVFSDRDGGCVVNAAIDLHLHVDFLTEGKTIRLHSEDVREHLTISAPGQIIYDGKFDRHKAALNMLPVTGGIEILARSDAPPGCGLGEAAALDTALVAGLARGRMEEYDAEELVELSLMLENGELGFSGGRQDHYPAVFGGFHELTFLEDRIDKRRLAVGEDAAADLARHMVLVYTGQSHFTKQTGDRVWAGYTSGNPEIGEALRAMRDVAKEVGSVLEAGDWVALAALVNKNWEFHQRLDAAMTTPHTVAIEEGVRRAGAWGLKATGDGAGGCFLAFGPPDQREKIATAASQCGATVLACSFTSNGVSVIEHDDATGNT